MAPVRYARLILWRTLTSRTSEGSILKKCNGCGKNVANLVNVFCTSTCAIYIVLIIRTTVFDESIYDRTCELENNLDPIYFSLKWKCPIYILISIISARSVSHLYPLIEYRIIYKTVHISKYYRVLRYILIYHKNIVCFTREFNPLTRVFWDNLW